MIILWFSSVQGVGSFDLIQEIELEMKKRQQSVSHPMEGTNASNMTAS
jgi:hypothetical protein